jgi:hypothetical protein
MLVAAQVALMSGDDHKAGAIVNQLRDEPFNSGASSEDLLFTQVYITGYAQDRLHESREFFEPVIAVLPIARFDWLGPLLLDAGDVDALRELARDPAATSEPPFDWMWIADMCLRAECLAAIGDAEKCRAQYAVLEPYADILCVAGTAVMVFGPVASYLGRLAEVYGDIDAARRHYAVALELSRRCGAPRWEADVQARLDALP